MCSMEDRPYLFDARDVYSYAKRFLIAAGAVSNGAEQLTRIGVEELTTL
jgi:hypothetical protein